MEAPECPVCLQPFDHADVVPRVLSCGHSACEPCLARLSSLSPSPSSSSSVFADTIRCPACTQLVRLPRALGPAALPKNIDLLRLLPPATPSSDRQPASSSPPTDPRSVDPGDFVPLPWSDDLLSRWSRWVLPPDAISIDSVGDAELLGAVVVKGKSACGGSSVSQSWGPEANQPVQLCPIGEPNSVETGKLELSYLGKVMKTLSRMSERERHELELLLTATTRQRRGLCDVYGLWMDSGKEASELYLVSERMRRRLSDAMVDGGFCQGNDGDELFAAMVGLEACEALISLHAQGIVCGCLTFSCLCFDVLGHCVLDVSEVLTMRSRLQPVVDRDSGPSGASVSPEALGLFCHDVACSTHDSPSSGYAGGYGSDVWSVAGVLATLLIGGSSVNQLQLKVFFDLVCSGKDLEHHYNVWMEKFSSELEVSLIGNRFEPLLQVLQSCFSYDPEMRPALSELWACLKGLLFPSQKDLFCTANVPTAKEHFICCLLLCDLVPAGRHSLLNLSSKSGPVPAQDSDAKLLSIKQADGKEIQEDKESGDLIKGFEAGKIIHAGYLECITCLQGHRDCITGLAVGGFLYC